MRDILFRGKRKDTGEWVYGYYAHIPCGRFKREEHLIQTIKKDGTIGLLHEVIPDTVGQDTGQTDKNGTKIFEGDICTCDREGGCFEVVWGKSFGYELLGDDISIDLGELYSNEICVIENIHDTQSF